MYTQDCTKYLDSHLSLTEICEVESTISINGSIEDQKSQKTY